MNKSYWVIAVDGQSYGPADEGTLAGWARQGRLTAETVLQDAQTNVRTTAGRVLSIASVFAPAGPPPPAYRPPPAYQQPAAYQQAAAYQQQQSALPAHLAYQPPAVVIQPVYYPPPGYVSPAHGAMMYAANQKNVGVAYLLWFFLGAFGAHRFYTGHSGSGVALLLLTILSVPLMFVLIGFVTFAIVGIWCFVDILLIPGLVQEHNQRLAARYR